MGSQIVDWVSEYLIVPDGPTAGEPLVLTGEQALLVLQLCIRRVLSRQELREVPAAGGGGVLRVDQPEQLAGVDWGPNRRSIW
ncbi:hypothetical protein [Streptomyces malaysiensis]|uniref:hypothetical protein n=1 Tax=Streptomyces malaysiensis TaxID=92644 RepID=UPI0033C45F0B